MFEQLAGIFSSAGFMPHGHCYLWTPALLWTFVISDVVIGLAYFSIPVALAYFVRRKPGFTFNWMMAMFAIFIFACGASHFMAVWNVWHADYWLDATVKAFTATASILTAVLIWPLIPKALAMPGPAQLQRASRELEQEITVRRQAELEVKKLNEELEQRVRLRTLEMEAANRELEKQIAERARAERELQQANASLERTVDRLAQRGRETTLLRQMGEMLQTCASSEEANQVVARYTQQLVPGHAGELYVHDANDDTFEMQATWGSSPPDHEVISADACWALRRGKPYVIRGESSDIVCRHVPPPLPHFAVCVPLTAHGEVLGLLHLRSTDAGNGDRDYLMQVSIQLAESIADYAALALADIKLRTSLRTQAIQDPLTGLYNRRFMEETLQRETRLAERTAKPVGILMLDIDRFKAFNDANGHETGDALLKALGEVLKKQVRGSDVACRYGGEEFTIILHEATPEFSAQRAEQLRQSVSDIKLLHQGKSYTGFTVSIGVASFPGHGATWEEVLRAADQALYAAKEQGRNRVIVADGNGRPSAPATSHAAH